jgi:hypothetical protein
MSAPQPSWKPSGIVTLTTDFGLEDPYVGMMKGVLLSAVPGLRLVDLTHGIGPQDVSAAAFFLAHSWRFFPAGCVHVCVVDPGVGSERRILVARQGTHAFVAPDNGLLGPVLDETARVFALEVGRFSLPQPSRTFHGRDVMAPTAARLAAGLEPAECGPEVGDWDRLRFAAPEQVSSDELRGRVLVRDRYGNLITNVTANALAGGADWIVECAGRDLPVRSAYCDVPVGQALALVDSYGYMELAVRDGSAAERLGLGPGAALVFKRRRA